MITLCMDTSSRFLVLALIKDHELLDSEQKDCWKRQSEELFPMLTSMMAKHNLEPEDIDQIVITEGPGSYTGVRIAMTVAKVFCVMKEIPLYTIGTLQLFAGKEDGRVILDARSKRVYTAVIKNGEYVEEPNIKTLDELERNEKMIGDLHLLDLEDNIPDLASNFLLLEDKWVKADNANTVTPEYLKKNEAYLVK